MIYVNLRGNLGNQMFEYAIARKLQEDYGQKICINYYNIAHSKSDYTCLLNNYKLNDGVVFEFENRLPFFADSQRLILRILRKFFPMITYNVLKKLGIFVWHGNRYVEIPKKYHKDFYIDGYFQSEKYFSSIKNIIKDEFTLKNEKEIKETEIYKKIINDDVTCVSVRRGDYVTNDKYKNIFYVCDEKYFKDAFKYLEEQKFNKSLMICSNDINWVRDNFNLGNLCYYEDESMNSVENLFIMSCCNNFVISNSTYNWWAQYLCDNPKKRVIAPSIWFRNGEMTDIYQDFWELIEIKEGVTK